MIRLSKLLGGPQLYVKRDDCTGLATGGNKTRKLDFLMGDALAQNADTIVTQGAVQSNHVRQSAAAAAKLGLKCHILLERRVPDVSADYETTGNVLLDKLYGADIEFRPAGVDMNAACSELADQLRQDSANPYIIPGGGSNPVGALGYVSCELEILGQANDMGLRIDQIVHATGSAGTQAGLVAGIEGCNAGIVIQGISVRHPKAKQEETVHALASKTADYLGIKSKIARERVMADDGYVGPGYGQATPEMVEAINLMALYEGILLDPVYSGKGMAGLIGHIRQGRFSKQDNVVFLHTGGSAALFAYQDLFRPAA